jgi:hypothetical protein
VDTGLLISFVHGRPVLFRYELHDEDGGDVGEFKTREPGAWPPAQAPHRRPRNRGMKKP